MSAVPTYLVAATTAAGGAIGFVKAGSKASLIAGLVSAIILGYAGSRIPDRFGYQLSISYSLLLGAMMGMRFMSSGKFMPAGLVATLALSLAVYNAFLFMTN
eukprot:CAMPEP_0114613770 /NCGR_PEP_ID=MMETSP0168-20121206/5305_1 /TAXON_ID=95228 ORGANISM="Vannella sp., Strain DIVA3 517/6/12" /NCGR_SAMPLE_ID=MMETSP0168 /ASSEMBLY_ACC=CAM_ASM_000044 /LENGTH=101 /DNA_ID=CAMNT_0001824789 /DNA_START=43 /DNA_END=348 /DNA_ORIENTATION=+